ncbi:MAG: glycosyltransferase [Bacteroidales bacterium]|nr:glycosyltransferase [Bacteroidales bacterium]
MPKVSVIVPFYNVEPYIERCARSLLGQTLQDMEYIFVDDGSTDNSLSVLNNTINLFSYRESQVKVISLPENGGQAKALAEGLKHISGDYVIKCDGDDEVELETYEELYNKAERENLDLVMFDFVQLYPDGSSVYMGQHLKDDMIFEMLTDKISTSVCNKLVRRSVFEDSFVYPSESMCEDFVYSIQYFYTCEKLGVINKPFYKYYRYPLSFLAVSDEETRIAKFNQLVDNLKKVFEIIEIHGDRGKYQDLIVAKKLKAKNFLLKYINKKQFYQLWQSAFSEINGKVMSCPCVTTRNKFFYILTLMHLYPLYNMYKKMHTK